MDEASLKMNSFVSDCAVREYVGLLSIYLNALAVLVAKHVCVVHPCLNSSCTWNTTSNIFIVTLCCNVTLPVM